MRNSIVLSYFFYIWNIINFRKYMLILELYSFFSLHVLLLLIFVHIILVICAWLNSARLPRLDWNSKNLFIGTVNALYLSVSTAVWHMSSNSLFTGTAMTDDSPTKAMMMNSLYLSEFHLHSDLIAVPTWLQPLILKSWRGTSTFLIPIVACPYF